MRKRLRVHGPTPAERSSTSLDGLPDGSRWAHRARCRVLSAALACATCAGLLSGCVHGPEVQPTTQGSPPSTLGAAVAAMNREAQTVQAMYKSRFAQDFLSAVPHLSALVPRRVGDRSVDEWEYYFGANPTPSESPIFYAHLLEIAAQDGGERSALIGRRVLDLHGRSIGPTRILAGAGADAVSLLSDPGQLALYSQPGDQGIVPIYGRDVAGRVQVLLGSLLGDAASFAAVGGGFDLVFSRGVLLRGTIHPSEATDPKTQRSLGMSDEDYLRRLFSLLKPGGKLLVYNLCPAPAPIGQPYNPYADCRSPFTQAQWQAAGFRVRDFDRSDTPGVRSLGKALGWDRPELAARAVDLDTNLFAQYTLVERP